MNKEEHLKAIEKALSCLYSAYMDEGEDHIENIITLNNLSISNTFNDLEKLLDKVFTIHGKGFKHKVAIQDLQSNLKLVNNNN